MTEFYGVPLVIAEQLSNEWHNISQKKCRAAIGFTLKIENLPATGGMYGIQINDFGGSTRAEVASCEDFAESGREPDYVCSYNMAIEELIEVQAKALAIAMREGW